MTQVQQVKQLDELGVEFAGFIFYPKSPRYVFKHIPAIEIKRIKGNINKVGVFVNADANEIFRTIDDCGLYVVQLHGDETPRFCETISDYITVVKAFRLSETDNIEWMVKDYQDVVDMFLFDTEGAGYGGTGKKFNWDKLKGMNIRKPFFLSGGIEPNDVSMIKNFTNEPVAKNLFSLDINSKFEISPGIKDIDLVKQFVTALKPNS